MASPLRHKVANACLCDVSLGEMSMSMCARSRAYCMLKWAFVCE